MSETNKAPDKISLLPDHEHGYVWIDGWASSEDEAECYLHVSQYNTKAEEIQRLRDTIKVADTLIGIGSYVSALQALRQEQEE